jgi:hypothetical protein
VIRQQAIRSGLPLEARQVRHMPPRQHRGYRAPDAGQRPPGGLEQVAQPADAVVGGGYGGVGSRPRRALRTHGGAAL